MSDFYATLGLDRGAGPDEIKQAYRRMAAKHHPDKGGDTAEFQKIQQAYETLSDPHKKQQYDNPNPFGPGGQGGPGGFHFNFGGAPGGFQFHTQGFDINDIFGQMFGHNPFRNNAATYRTAIAVTLEQVYKGDEHIINLNSPQGPKTIKVQIPQGIPDGTVLKYDNIIPNATLLVEFRIQPNDKFERQGNHLLSVHEINILDLIVGGSFKFTTISGRVLDVIVNPRTQPGAKMRLSGEGMTYQGQTGDQYILLKPFVPDIIDSRILDAIRQHK